MSNSFTRNTNMLNISFVLASFFLEPKTWHGDSQSHFFFLLWMLLASLLLCSGGAASLLIFRAPEDIKIWVSFLPIPKLNATACLILQISGVFYGFPPRIDYYLVLGPSLNWISSGGTLCTRPRYPFVVLLFRVITS